EHMHQQTANAALIRMGFGGELVAHGMRSRQDRRRRSFSP
ncbi:integrase, partial [Salmonella enterica]